jgi:spore coat protein U-like protein
VWGDGSAGTSTMTSAKNAMTVLDIFGSIPEGQDPAVGNYTDSIVVTVNF